MGWFGLAVVTYLGALPQLELVDAHSCVAPLELARELDAWLPDDGLLRAMTLRIEVRRAGKGGRGRSLSIRLRDDEREGAALTRELSVLDSDCPELPRLIAQILARHLESVIDSAQPAVEARPTPPQEEEPIALWRLRSCLTAGVDLGLGPLAPQGRLEAQLSLDRQGASWMALALHGTVGSAQEVGSGEARLFGAAVAAAVGVSWQVGPVELRPEANLAVGLHVADGKSFSQELRPVLPRSSVGVALGSKAPWDLVLRAGLEIALHHVELRERGSDLRPYREPWGRLVFTAGYALSEHLF